MTRPSGVVSKKDMRVFMTDLSNLRCNPVAAVSAATIQAKVLAQATSAETTPIALYPLRYAV